MAAYHPFSEKKYRWDRVCKTLTAGWVEGLGWKVKPEPEVFRHDLVIERGGDKKILELEARNMIRFNMVWEGRYDEVHAPTRRFTHSKSDAEWVVSYPMDVMNGDRRVYRVQAKHVKKAYEDGHIEEVPVENMGWEPDSFVLVPREHYEFLDVPQDVWDAWNERFSEDLFKSFAL